MKLSDCWSLDLSWILLMGLVLLSTSSSGAEEVGRFDAAQLLSMNYPAATSEEVEENLEYALKVRGPLSYREKPLSDDLWQDWVLPMKVLDEDVCLWRAKYYDLMKPLVEGKKNTREAVEAIHHWLLLGEEPPLVFGFEGACERRRTINQVLASGKAAWGEICMVYVYLLRSVGIPARHCTVGFYTSRDGSHFYCEYWDSQEKNWVPLDASAGNQLDPELFKRKVASGSVSTLATYAYPGAAQEGDPYCAVFLSDCINVTANLSEPFEVKIVAPDEGKPVYGSVWNNGSWRVSTRCSGEQAEEMRIATYREADLPVLFSQMSGSRCFVSIEQPAADSTVELVQLKPGECVRWTRSGGFVK